MTTRPATRAPRSTPTWSTTPPRSRSWRASPSTIANHDDAPVEDPDTDITWGHVGDIASTRKALQELSDRLFSEGEYAEVACLRCPATFGTSAELAAHYRTAH